MTATLNLTASVPSASPARRVPTAKATTRATLRGGWMSSVLASDLTRNLACGAAAMLITAVFSLTFVQTTQAVPGSRTAAPTSTHHFHLAKLSIHRGRAWFGQTEPAVLVD